MLTIGLYGYVDRPSRAEGLDRDHHDHAHDHQCPLVLLPYQGVDLDVVHRRCLGHDWMRYQCCGLGKLSGSVELAGGWSREVRLRIEGFGSN